MGKNLLKVSKITLEQRPRYFSDFEQAFAGWEQISGVVIGYIFVATLTTHTRL